MCYTSPQSKAIVQLDEDILDELLEDYVRDDEGGTPTSERVLEVAFVADATEIMEELRRVTDIVSANPLTDPPTRADVIQALGRLRTFLGNADRIIRSTHVSGILTKVSLPPRDQTG